MRVYYLALVGSLFVLSFFFRSFFMHSTRLRTRDTTPISLYFRFLQLVLGTERNGQRERERDRISGDEFMRVSFYVDAP